MDVDAKTVRESLDYNPETGALRWKKNKTGGTKAGDEAGSRTKDGYIRVRVARYRFLAHRVAWLHFYGTWPSKHIDHINHVKDDNRIGNLRLADDRQNQANRRHQRNKSGVRGVSWKESTKRWVARIRINGSIVHLGGFKSKELAGAAYRAASLKYHGEFSFYYDHPEQVTR